MMGGLVFLLILICLPETSAKILRKREKYKEKGYHDQEDNPQESIFKSMARPFQFITKPVVILATTPYSIAYGFMYFIIASLPHQLATHYNFSSYQIGLAFLANGIGNAVGALTSGRLSDRALGKIINPEKRIPELRLQPMWIGIILLPAGQLIYGWCIQFDIHVMAGLTGLFLCKYKKCFKKQ
jgi:MFS family permease